MALPGFNVSACKTGGVYAWLVVAVLVISAVHGQSQWHCRDSVPALMQAICGGCYRIHNSQSSAHTAEDYIIQADDYNSPRVEIEEQYNAQDSAFLDKKRALNYLTPDVFKRQVTIGIIDECCRRQCSFSELSAYCGVPGIDC